MARGRWKSSLPSVRLVLLSGGISVLRWTRVVSHSHFGVRGVVFAARKLEDGNTTNLYSHLKNRHPELYADVSKGKSKAKHHVSQPLLSEVFHKL